MPAPKRHQEQSVSGHDEAIDDYINHLEKLNAELEESLRDCVALAAGHISSYMLDHGLKDYHPEHKEMINRAQRLLGGRELP